MNQSAAHVINEVVAIGKFLDKVPAGQKKNVASRKVELLTQKIQSVKQLQTHMSLQTFWLPFKTCQMSSQRETRCRLL